MKKILILVFILLLNSFSNLLAEDFKKSGIDALKSIEITKLLYGEKHKISKFYVRHLNVLNNSKRAACAKKKTQKQM